MHPALRSVQALGPKIPRMHWEEAPCESRAKESIGEIGGFQPKKFIWRPRAKETLVKTRCFQQRFSPQTFSELLLGKKSSQISLGRAPLCFPLCLLSISFD